MNHILATAWLVREIPMYKHYVTSFIDWIISIMMACYIMTVIDAINNKVVTRSATNVENYHHLGSLVMLAFGSYMIHVFIQKCRIRYYDHVLYKPLSYISTPREAEFIFVILWSMVERMGENGNFIKFIGFL